MIPILKVHDRKNALSLVSADTGEALVDAFSAKGSRTPEAWEEAQKYLKVLRQNSQWLQCCCTPSHPILVPYIKANKLWLRKKSKAVPHALLCPFFEALREADDEEGEGEGKAGEYQPRLPFSGSILLLASADTRLPSPKKKSAGPQEKGERKTREPKIGGILRTWLERTLYTRIASADVQKKPLAHAQLKLHYSGLDTIKSDPIPGTPLKVGDILSTYFPSLPSLKGFLRKHRGDFPAKKMPMGYYAGIVHATELVGTEHHLLYRSSGKPECREPVFGRFTRLVDANAGPYIAIVQFAEEPKSRQFVATEAFLHPVVSTKLLLPVESHFERTVATFLLEQMAYWRDQYQLDSVLHKPLHDLPVEGEDGAEEQFARPDFLLKFQNGRSLAIEAAGRDDEDYETRKERTQTLMRRIAGVVDLIEFTEETDFTSLDTKKDLTKHALRISNHAGKDKK